MKELIHNEWFRRVSLGNRKSCPTCREKLSGRESIWSWGEYNGINWRTVKHFCRRCYKIEVKTPLTQHAGPCGCKIAIVGYQGETIPSWLKLPKKSCPTK